MPLASVQYSMPNEKSNNRDFCSGNDTTTMRQTHLCIDKQQPDLDTPFWEAKPVLYPHPKTLSLVCEDGIKRGIDILAATLLLLFGWPLFALLALLVKCGDGGPVLFWQIRVGKGERLFWLPKFRSMLGDAEARKSSLQQFNERKDGVAFKMRNDPRITGVGRFLRRFSLDELPQLWCVLIGEMSLVGPRPPIPEEVALYSEQDRLRLTVKPGLTCLWQIQGRGDLSFRRQVQLDLQYIQNRSLKLDLWILWRTLPAVLSGKGAY